MELPFPHLGPKVEHSGDVTVITFSGRRKDMDNRLAGELEEPTADPGAGHLLLDFKNIQSLGSMELGTLVTLHKRLRDTGGRLTLFNVSPMVTEVFTVTRLDTLLRICTTGPPTARK